MFHHMFEPVVFASLLGLAALSLGCGKSPVSPGVVAATTATTAVSVTSISPARGLTGDTIRVSGIGFRAGATLTVDGLTATIFSTNNNLITAEAPAHPAGTADVVVTNPGGESARLPGGYSYEFVSVTASPSVVRAGGQLTMSWVAPGGRNCSGGGDWVAIYKVGDPDITGAANGHSDLWYDHLCGATSGTFVLSAPMQPGQYEFRYMVSDAAAAQSNSVTITAAASRLAPAVRARER